ncbi:hypothetical protein MY04_2009 [Flammeovirga sp. MY04]|uniref:hypothetical protein n=1 Tax=Flammeovirga sp. MY04 TaxID=1191459 RepID=UPI00080614B6|nr:hypothetical protein [Flammeovirga sp. MY04]ANQ49383.1 hypothetical protein MY04_2009 [Flammeovirga sp. MY04]
MFNFLKRNKKNNKQLISVIEYPDSFVFETYFKMESGVWNRTDIVSVVTKDTPSINFFELLMKHLDASKMVKVKHFDYNKMTENYKRIVGRKSMKSQMKDAKVVQVYRENSEIQFTPMKNGGTVGKEKGFTEISDKEIKLNANEINSDTINNALFECFNNCL